MMKLSQRGRLLLEKPLLGVLATTNANGKPHISPIWYLLEPDGTILMNTEISRKKYRNIKRSSSIALCVHDGGYRYVAMMGEVEIVDNQQIAHQDIYRLACRYDGRASAERFCEEIAEQHRISLYLRDYRVYEYFSKKS